MDNRIRCSLGISWCAWVPTDWRKDDVPAFATDGSAGLDIRAHLYDEASGIMPETLVLQPGEAADVNTGLKVEIQPGYVGKLYLRSGQAKADRRLVLRNSVGIIDSDYRGEVRIMVANNHPYKPLTIKNRDRFVQLILMPVPLVNVIVSESLSDTARGSGGFGHTGS